MKSRLPATPMDTLKLSGLVRLIVLTVHRLADAFGFWDYPNTKAAGDFEDMTLMDKIYWGYKSKNPILFPEKTKDRRQKEKRGLKPPEVPGGMTHKRTVTFAAVGDLIKVDGLENSRGILYRDVVPYIFGRDVSVANLESQMTNRDVSDYVFSDKETPPLCCTRAQYNALKGHRELQYTVMHTACNHSLDMGVEGLETTMDLLEKDGIINIGTNRKPAERYKGKIIERNGIKIGFVSATFGLNGKPVPEGKEHMVNVVKFHPRGEGDGNKTDLTLLRRQIDYCKEEQCDVIIGSLHWGYEYEFFPRRKQVNLAHELVEMGVDVILSHHAHVVQPIEFYRPKRNPSRSAVITYSLGNLTSNYSAPHLVLSAILNFTVTKGMINGLEDTYIEDVQIIPVVQTEVISQRQENMDVDAPENQKPTALRLVTLEKLFREWGETKEKDDYISAIDKYRELVGFN